jgi:hypothetical protein
MKIKLLSLLVASAIAGAATPAFALDDAAILKRLEKLETQRKADQAEIDALRNKVQQLEGQKGNAVSSDEASKLHEEIVKVDQKATSRIESAKKTIEGERDKLKINGYMSVYGVKSTNKAVDFASGIDNHVGFNSDTIAGIQFDYKMDENLDAVVQLRAEGRNNYEVETPWAFLRYKLTPTTTVRAGRMVAPVYLYADSLDIGYTYPWVRPPVEMYSTSSPLFTGVDLTQSFNFGGWDNSLQVVYGDSDRSTTGSNISTDYTAGLALTFNNAAWTFRTAAFHSENFSVAQFALLPDFLGVGAGSLDYYSAAIRYDDGALLVLVEGRKIATNKKLEKAIADSDGFYTTVGYQLDKFMPYVTWAKAYSTNEKLAPIFIQESLESVGLGLRYNLTNKIVIKGEATKYNHFDGTAGVSTMTTLPGAYAADPANLPTLQKLDQDGATVMSLGVDAIF